MPVIDRAAHVPNVYYAFGHGQTGLIGASTTGRLIAELVGGASRSSTWRLIGPAASAEPGLQIKQGT